MATANFNYLHRRKIKRTKNFLLSRHEGTSEYMMVALKLDKSLLNFVEQHEVVRIEASSRGVYFSQDLLKSDEPQIIEIEGIHKKDSPSFRIYSVSDSDRSRIRRASADFKLNSGKGKPKKKKVIKKEIPAEREGFFNFAYADIGSGIYQLRWEAGLEIVVSERLQGILQDEIQRNAGFRASFLPSLVKEILLGIVIRHESLDELGEKEKDWIGWANEMNLFCDDEEHPSVYFKEQDGAISQEWFDWCDICYENFCSGLHFNGENYLDNMVRQYES